MLKKLVGNTTFFVSSALYLSYAYEEGKRRLEKLGETETVYNEYQYVAVRFARGDYRKENGFDQAINDFKFYRIIKPRD